jgi:hypothetical protein
MSASIINQAVAQGYAIAAAVVGVPFTWYRPASPIDPLTTETPFGTLQAYVTPLNQDPKIASNDIKLEDWIGTLDTTLALPGDILVAPPNTVGFPSGATFFVAAVEFGVPARLVRCNFLAQVNEPPSDTENGLLAGYAGDEVAEETLIARGLPVAIMQGTKGEKGDLQLPGDVRDPWSEILIPVVPGLSLRSTMRVLTPDVASGGRILSSVIQNWQMFRCTAMTADS